MSNLITDWRTALVDLLEETFPAAEVLSGFRSGLSRDRDRIAVFWARTPVDGNVNYLRPQIAIRFWPKQPRQPRNLREGQLDETPLEQAAWDLTNALMPVRTTLVANLYFELAGITPNRADFSVEAQLIAYLLSPGAVPA